MLNVRKRVVANRKDAPQGETEHKTRQVSQQAAADFLHRLQNGDEKAWQQLSAEWTPKLYRYLRSQLPTAEDAEDVASETLVSLVKSIKSFDGKAALSTFIFTIANRRVVDFWRKRKDATELPETVSTAGPTNQGIELQEAMAKLPEQARQALLLRYQMGLSVDEVAKSLGRSYKATESLLSRSRSQLQVALNGDD